MRKIWVIIGMILVMTGCVRRWEYEGVSYSGPNWTSDGKIVFIRHHYIQRWEKVIPAISEHQAGGSEEITVYEINNDGTGLRKVVEIDSCEFEYGPELGGISTSSAGDWIVLSIEDWNRGEHYPVMYVVKRNGDSLREIGSGTYPDFSPDASKIVYEKPNQGIWIMNRDGSNDHCIVSDSSAKYPAWSPDDTLIAYGEWWTHIVNLDGDSLKAYKRLCFLDWGPEGSGNILVQPYYGLPIILNILEDTQETLTFGAEKWSEDGEYFIGYEEGGYYIIKKDGTNKWYLKDKIGGE